MLGRKIVGQWPLTLEFHAGVSLLFRISLPLPRKIKWPSCNHSNPRKSAGALESYESALTTR